MLAGAASVLGPAQCALIGGHSGEGQQAALGFSVTGTAPADALLRKGGLRCAPPPTSTPRLLAGPRQD